MTRQRYISVATLAALVLGCVVTLGAQTTDVAREPAPAQAGEPAAAAPARQPRTARPPVPDLPQPPRPPEPDPDSAPDADTDAGGRRQDIVRIGQDVTLAAGEEARDVVVIMGNAVVDGHMRNLVVVMGSARLGPTAVVDRTVTSVAGGVTIAQGATVGQDVVVVGGSLDAPPSFGPGRQHVVISPPFVGKRINAVVPYFTRGLLWGRVIVPDLGWLWAVVGLFFIVYLAVNVLADGPVRAAASVLDGKTLTAFGTGLLVLLVIGPVSLLLAVSVVGLLVIPVLHFALLATAIVGKVGTFRWLGGRVWNGEDSGSLRAAATFLIGFAIVTLIYMVPVLGLAAFALLGVLSLGAGTLAFVAAYRKEQPTPPPVAPPPIPPPGVPLPTPSAGPAGDSSGSTARAEAPAYVQNAGYDVPAIPMTSAPPLPAHMAADVAMLPRAAFRDRLAAFVLDLILVVLVVQVVWPFRGGRVFFLAMLAYHIGFWAWKHTTVGGIICHLRIVRADGAPLTLGDAVIRGLSAIFSVVVIGLGFLWVLRDPERQSWHDKIAGTYVVKVPRNWRS